MRVVRLHGHRDVRLSEEPVPAVGQGMSLVRVTAVGLCGSDLRWYEAAGLGDSRLDRPVVPGHELAGVIEGGPRGGERVAVDPAIPCRSCQICLAGHKHLCPRIRFAGHGILDGGLQEYLAWPSSLLPPLPDALSDADGAMLEPLGVALHAIDLGRVRLGASVAVAGCGPIGLLLVQAARVAGASTVIATDPLPHRRQAAERLGADHAWDAAGLELAERVSATVGPGVDVAFEAAGTDPAVAAAMTAARPGARVVLVGIPDQDSTTFPASLARRKGLTIAMARRMNDAYPRAIRLAQHGSIDLASLVTDRYPLAAAPDAFAAAASRRGIKTIVAAAAAVRAVAPATLAGRAAHGPSQEISMNARNRPEQCVIGIDYGTLSGRVVVVRTADGAELASAVHDYRHGVVDRTLPATGERLPPDWALQVPSDYLDVLKTAVPEAVAKAGIDPSQVIGIGTDFTACTILPTLADGTPLSELPTYAGRPHAYTKLWKHHAAQPHADRINELARDRKEPWLPRYGGLISSEWEFAKALQLLEEDPEIYAATRRWVEAADWIVWQLTGRYVRNACTAGYKGIRQDGRYPSRDYLAALNPDFAGFVEEKLEAPIGALGERAGGLTGQAASWTGLPAGIAVPVGNVDAHVTVPAANAVGPGQLVAIMGTSTCHVMNSEVLREVPGMCGVVDGGILAGRWGYEAGQSGVGDIFAWFVDTCVPPEYGVQAQRRGVDLHAYLSELAAPQRVGEHGLIALDWHSGNRSVLVDHELSGVVVGQTLATRPEDTYRALLEATAFGTRRIIEAFTTAGIEVTELVVAGGLLKNPVLMQIYADVTRLPLSTIASEEGPALGSAIHAAVAAGAYPDVPAAAAAMGRCERAVYRSDPARKPAYDALYSEYLTLHDYFGRGTNDVMHRLRDLRRAAVAR